MRKALFFIPFLLFALQGCGVYSFTGASIEGKTIYMHMLENRAQNVVPSLAATLTDKLRSRILSQTGLSPIRDVADYDITGTITAYNVTVTAVTGTQTASKNRLTISVQIIFKTG